MLLAADRDDGAALTATTRSCWRCWPPSPRSRSARRAGSRANAPARRRWRGCARRRPTRRRERETLSRVIETQERERRRIAQDLHDRTAGGLTSVLFALRRARAGASPTTSSARCSARRARAWPAAIEDVRDLIADLRPKVLDDFGLGPALERLCETIARRSGLEVRAELGDGLDRAAAGCRDRHLPDRRRRRSRNVARHAGARTRAVAAAIGAAGSWSRSRTTAAGSGRARSATASRA